MARPIVRNVPFSGLSVEFSGPPGGFVWTVQVTVPKAQPYQSYLILLNGVQVSSMQGTAVYGPIQLYQGDELTITNNAGGVDAGQSGILYGQIDAEGHQPSGVFPAVSGGTVQTTGLNQIIWQGTWDSATTYAVNDLVEYEGSSYICIAVNSDTVPTNNSFWNLVAEVGGAGPTGPQGPPGPVGMNWTGAWSSTTAYAVGDGVYSGGSSYICTVANTNEPPPDTGYWSEIAAAATGVDATSIQGVAVSATAPTTGQVLQASSGTAAAWTIPPSGGPLTRTYYNPASNVSVASGASGAWLPLDATNLTVTFTMPASGEAYVSLKSWIISGAAGPLLYWGLLDHGTDTLASDVALLVNNGPAGNWLLDATVKVTGTAGTSYTFDWGATSKSTAFHTGYGGGVSPTSGAAWGPAVMTVWGS